MLQQGGMETLAGGQHQAECSESWAIPKMASSTMTSHQNSDPSNGDPQNGAPSPSKWQPSKVCSPQWRQPKQRSLKMAPPQNGHPSKWRPFKTATPQNSHPSKWQPLKTATPQNGAPLTWHFPPAWRPPAASAADSLSQERGQAAIHGRRVHVAIAGGEQQGGFGLLVEDLLAGRLEGLLHLLAGVGVLQLQAAAGRGGLSARVGGEQRRPQHSGRHPPEGLQPLVEPSSRVRAGGGQEVVQQQPPHRLLHQLAEGRVEDDELEVVEGERPLDAGWKAEREGQSPQGGMWGTRAPQRPPSPCCHWLSAFLRYTA